MALSLSTAKMTSGRKAKQGKVISEYGSKASPRHKHSGNGASHRYKKGKK